MKRLIWRLKRFLYHVGLRKVPPFPPPGVISELFPEGALPLMRILEDMDPVEDPVFHVWDIPEIETE